MTRKEQIKSAYRLTGGHASFYDGMMTYATLPGKAICRLVWNMDGKKNLRYVEDDDTEERARTQLLGKVGRRPC